MRAAGEDDFEGKRRRRFIGSPLYRFDLAARRQMKRSAGKTYMNTNGNNERSAGKNYMNTNGNNKNSLVSQHSTVQVAGMTPSKTTRSPHFYPQP